MRWWGDFDPLTGIIRDPFREISKSFIRLNTTVFWPLYFGGAGRDRKPLFGSIHPINTCTPLYFGGAGRDRTDDPLLAKQMLSQLSYSPMLKIQHDNGGPGKI
jgi:hypothetical protein